MRELLLRQYEPFLIIASILGLYLILVLLTIFLERTVKLPRRALNMVKWIAMFVIVSLMDKWRIAAFDAEFAAKALLLAKFVIIWRFLSVGLDLFFSRLRDGSSAVEESNRIYVDVVKLLILFVISAAALKTAFNLDMGSILTSSAILTAVIGFSMQDTIGSLAAGLLMQSEKSLELGQWIKVGNVTGRVVETNWRFTKLETLMEYHVYIPNNNIPKNDLINFSSCRHYVWVEVKLPAPLNVPPVKAKYAIMEALGKCSLVKCPPGPRIYFDEVSDHRALYNIWFAVERFDLQYNARDQVMTTLWYAFQAEGISWPRPRREVYMTELIREPDLSPEVVETIKPIKLFQGLPDKELRFLALSSTIAEFPAETRIVSEGDADSKLYIILEGRVRVSKYGQGLAELTKGNFFGEMSLLTGQPRKADVDALEFTKCLAADREQFRMLMDRNPTVIDNINSIFKDRIKAISSFKSEEDLEKTTQETLFSRFIKLWGL